ncbi:MAG TPA: isochorismatase family protein [Myxococcota bacterium]
MLDRARSLLLVIDLQEAYRGKLHEEERTIGAARRLLQAAGLLGIPVLLTEQYPKGLGATRAEVAECLPPDTPCFEKTSFSCLGAPGLQERLSELARGGRDQIVVAGIETHVCVAQTIQDLIDHRREVHAVRDAITARFPLDDAIGWERARSAGAHPITSEGALFEWLRDARAPEFKAIHRLVV